jgi:hypothetical protein
VEEINGHFRFFVKSMGYTLANEERSRKVGECGSVGRGSAVMK